MAVIHVTLTALKLFLLLNNGCDSTVMNQRLHIKIQDTLATSVIYFMHLYFFSDVQFGHLTAALLELTH